MEKLEIVFLYLHCICKKGIFMLQYIDNKTQKGGNCMANKGNMTLRIEPELKAQAAALFKSLGLDLSTATGIFYRQALRCHGLPFEVRLDEPNKATYAAMEAAEKDEDMEGPFDSVAELMEVLDA